VSVQQAGEANKSYAAAFSYTAAGAISIIQMGNGLVEQTTFNQRLQPVQIKLGTVTSPSSVVQLDYGYGTTNNNGNLLSQTITAPKTTGGSLVLTQTYGYDALNRLQSAGENGTAWQQTYDCDRFGNRAVRSTSYIPNPQLTPQSASLTDFSAFDQFTNRLSVTKYPQVMYDFAGNLKRDQAGSTFTYDGESRQVSASVGSTSASYSYDGDGRRVKKVIGTVTTVFVYNARGQMVAEYVSDPVPPPAGGGGTSYLTADTLGSTRVVTKADGSVKARYDYLPFGEELPSSIGGRSQVSGYGSADSTKQKFTAKERDVESGLDYFGARYYSAAQGRFTSVDPFDPVLGKQGANDKEKAEKEFFIYLDQPQHWNRYPYALNNPLRYIDPDGFGETIVVGLNILWDKDAHYTDEEKEEIKRQYITEAKETFKNIDITFVVVSEAEGTATNLANNKRTVNGHEEGNLNVFFTKKSDLPSTEVTRYDQGTVFIRTHGINFVSGAFQPEYHETDLAHGIIHAFGVAGDVYPSGSLGAELDTSTTRFLLRLGNNPGYEDDVSKRSKILGPKITNVLRDGSRKYAIGAKKP
jgi:RHS repeat-associated protein